MSVKLETIQEDEFGNKYAAIKQGCYLRAIARNTPTTREDVEQCKASLGAMTISDAANFTFTGRGINPPIKNFADTFNRRNTEYSINMVRNILATGSIEFGSNNKASTAVVNPIVSQKLLGDYLRILEKHGITEIDTSRIINIRQMLNEIDSESRKMANVSDNSFLDSALKLYENKYSRFVSELTTEIHNFEDKKTREIYDQATAASQPHASGIKKINLMSP